MPFEQESTEGFSPCTTQNQPSTLSCFQPAHDQPLCSQDNSKHAPNIEQMAARIKELEQALIEERSKVERQRLLADSRFTAFMTHTPALAWINDQAGNLLFHNKFLSIPNPEQQIGKNIAELVPAEIARQYQENNRIVLETNQPLQVVEPILLADGIFGQALVYKFPLPDLSGEIMVGGVGIDITDRFRIQEQLRQSEERYRLVVDNLKEVVFQADPSGNFLFLNPAWSEITGFSVEESIGNYFLDYVHPQDRQDNLSLFYSLIEGKKDYCRHETRYLTADGSFRWMAVFARLTFNSQGAVLGISGTFNDITAPKEAEKALKQRANEFEALVENAPDIISRFDCQFRHRYVNKAVETITGIPADRFIGKTNDELGFPQQQIKLWQNALEEVFNTQQERVVEFEFLSPDGIRYFHSRLVPEFGENGRVETVLTITRDITERKQAEELAKIRAAQQKVVAELGKLALEGVELDVFLTEITSRVASNLKAKYTQVVESLPGGREFRLRAGTGWEKSQIGTFKRERGTKSISNYTLATGKPVIADYLGEDQPFSLPGPLQNKGIASGLCVPIDNHKQKEPFGVISVYTLDRRIFTQDDINFLESIANLIAITIEHKKMQEESLSLERQFLQSQKMESLGVLAGGIAHDFNNLLGAILGNTELSKLMLAENNPALQYLEKTITAIQRAAELVQQLLAYGGRAQFQALQTNLNELVNEMGDLLFLPLTNKIDLQFNLQADLPQVLVDPTQMRQVVMNLISNSKEAIGSNEGTIILRTGLIRADRKLLDSTYFGNEREEGTYVFFELADSGSGMDQATQTRIFEPFFTTKFTGRGLGLSAILGIVRSYQGAIKVESEVGKGTNFTILFPVSPENLQSQSKGIEAEQTATATTLLSNEKRNRNEEGKISKLIRTEATKGTILIIEDEEVLRETIGRILRGLNYRPLIAGDGRSGLEIFEAKKEEIDCVLLDLVMPQMGGEEVLPRLQELKPQVKVIIMSGYSESDVANLQLLKEGSKSAFLQKPFTIETLTTVINRILGT